MSDQLQGKKIAFLVANEGVEQVELTEPLKAVREAGAEAVLLAPDEGEIQAFNHLDKGDTFPVDAVVGNVDAGDYDGLVLPGGRAPEYLRNRPKAVAIVRHFVDAGKPIAANCHGPLLLFAAGYGRGQTMTCYPDLAPDVQAAGGEFVDREVVVSGPVVTVRGWPDNGPWMREFVRLLKRGDT